MFTHGIPPVFRDDVHIYHELPSGQFRVNRFVWREAVFDEATGVVVTLPVRIPITRSVGENVFPLKFEPTPTSKQPSAVIRPIPQFE